MNIEKYLTKDNLDKIVHNVHNKKTSYVPYAKYKSVLTKVSYCKRPKYMYYGHYAYNTINDIPVICGIKGVLRFVSIGLSNKNKLKLLKKDIPYPLKMKLLDIIKNKYIMSKLDIYEYPLSISRIYDNSIFVEKYIMYPINSLYAILFEYLSVVIKYTKKNPILIYLTNNTNNILHSLYFSIIYKTKYNKELTPYVKNTNIIKILHSDYTDEEQRYNDYVREIKKYDNLKILNRVVKNTKKEANKIIQDTIYTKAFREYAIKASSKFKKYTFDKEKYKLICKNAGILNEYNKMIKSVDACDKQ